MSSIFGKSKVNTTLGEKVRDYLISLGLENPDVGDKAWGMAHQALQVGVHKFLMNLNLLPDPSRDDTPRRVADMYIEDLCWGLNYEQFPKCTTTPNGQLQDGQVVVGNYDQMVRIGRIRTTSLCEHHFQPIIGWTHIAYVPNTEVMGLSKFARVTDFFARRPQIQERMTEQLHAALSFILETGDVAVVQDCEHFCMRARGVMEPESITRTSKMGGRFMSNPALRQEFFHNLGDK